MKKLSLIVAVWLLAGTWSDADDAADKTPGLKVGAKAPAVELKDQNGTVRKLNELAEDGYAALVFYRSADW